MRTTAMSTAGSAPSTWPDASVPSARRTVTVPAPFTTWALVMMRPSAPVITPEPSPRRVSMVTTEGRAAWATPAMVPAGAGAAGAVAEGLGTPAGAETGTPRGDAAVLDDRVALTTTPP